VAWLRDAVPDIAVRTTVLVGFPTETPDDVRTLLDFMDEVAFDRLGVFPYSPQDGTRAAALPDDVPETEKRSRVDQVVELQRAVSGERLARHVGRDVALLVDEGAAPDDPGDLVARAPFQADDVDGVTYLRTRKAVGPGDLLRARVVDALDYDLVAEA
jgi:ribosomal protein S12 methylthiotransferase